MTAWTTVARRLQAVAGGDLDAVEPAAVVLALPDDAVALLLELLAPDMDPRPVGQARRRPVRVAVLPDPFLLVDVHGDPLVHVVPGGPDNSPGSSTQSQTVRPPNSGYFAHGGHFGQVFVWPHDQVGP